MIQLVRVSDGAPANADSEIEAEKLEVQGYRRVHPRMQQPAQPPATEPQSAGQPEESADPADDTTADTGTDSAPLDVAGRRRATR